MHALMMVSEAMMKKITLAVSTPCMLKSVDEIA